MQTPQDCKSHVKNNLEARDSSVAPSVAPESHSQSLPTEHRAGDGADTDESSAASNAAADLREALALVDRLPLSDEEKTAIVRRLLGGE
jgi:hypothetical protein